MGSAASTDRAERRRRDRALGQGEASTTEALETIPEDTEETEDVRRKGCKVSPEPKEAEEPAAALPGSPSFRIYCQDAAGVDALVAASDAEDESDEPARATDSSASHQIPSGALLAETTLAIRKNDLAHGSGELSKSKEPNRWMKFRGQAIVDAMYTLFICRSKAAASARPPSHHPPAAVAAKTRHHVWLLRHHLDILLHNPFSDHTVHGGSSRFYISACKIWLIRSPPTTTLLRRLLYLILVVVCKITDFGNDARGASVCECSSFVH